MGTASLTERWAQARPAVRARARWVIETEGRPEQRTPPGDWNVWLFMAGRGTGKTRAAAEDMAHYGLTHPRSRLAVVAPTYADCRDTCIEGESGLLACLPREEVANWNRSLGELVLRNGTRYKLFSSDEPDRLRGPQHERAWCDELAAFRSADTWDMLQMGLRLGQTPQCVVTTTPRPVGLLRELLDRSDVVVTRATTWDNAANLAPAALESLRRRYEGTRIGRQELLGEYVDEAEGALWRREWIERTRVDQAPSYGYRAVMCGLDPSDGTPDGAWQGLVVAASGLDRELYVIHSERTREHPYEWLGRAVDVAREHEAVLQVEKNFGGGYLVDLLEQAMKEKGVRVPYRAVDASESKRVRAEPVAALYEQGRVHHIGRHPDLEDQMASFTGAKGEKSPDLLDALVWAMRPLMGYSTDAPTLDSPGRVAAYTDRPSSKVVAWG